MLAYLIQESSIKTRRLWLVLSVIFTLLLAASASCGYESHSPPAPQAGQAQQTQTGLASFYSRAFDGEETASGELFDSREMVAAHPSYPLGTVVRVTNLEKGGAVEVRIHDRGPSEENQIEGVIIDLSGAAAEKLGMVKDGRCRVQLEVLEWGSDKRK